MMPSGEEKVLERVTVITERMVAPVGPMEQEREFMQSVASEPHIMEMHTESVAPAAGILPERAVEEHDYDKCVNPEGCSLHREEFIEKRENPSFAEKIKQGINALKEKIMGPSEDRAEVVEGESSEIKQVP